MITDEAIIALDDTMLPNEDSLPLNPAQAEALQMLLGSRVSGRMQGGFISDTNIQQQLAQDAQLAAELAGQGAPNPSVQGAQASAITRLEIAQEEARAFVAASNFFARWNERQEAAPLAAAVVQERPSTTCRPMQAFRVNFDQRELREGNLRVESVSLVFDRTRQIRMGTGRDYTV